MKRYALRFTEGQFKGEWIGSNGCPSKTHPKLYTKKGMAEKRAKYINDTDLWDKKHGWQTLGVVTFHLVEEDQLPVKVDIWEYERGWGSKVDSTKNFATVGGADAYVKDYNETHNPPVKSLNDVSDWYMVAKRRGT